MNNQKITSAGTSINKTRIPSAFRKVTPHGHICDYGCGKYTEHIENYCCDMGALSYSPYDPYNLDPVENAKTKYVGDNHKFDIVYICNVLNVIDNDESILEILKNAFEWCMECGQIVIQIYEGDETGTGRETKKDCYQRNMKTIDYLQYLVTPCILNQWKFRWELKSNIIHIYKYR